MLRRVGLAQKVAFVRRILGVPPPLRTAISGVLSVYLRKAGLRGRAASSTGTMRVATLLVFFVVTILFASRSDPLATNVMDIDAKYMPQRDLSPATALADRADVSGERDVFVTGEPGVQVTSGTERITDRLLTYAPPTLGTWFIKYITEIYPTYDPIALGVWPGGTGFGNPPWNNASIDYYAEEVGYKPDFVLWFQSWGPDSDGVFPRTRAEDIHQRGYAQVITWQPQDYTAPGDDPNYSLDSILSGRHDSYIRRYARDLAAWGRSVYLRPFHEMNGDWYPYGAGKNGNTPEKLVSAWRKIYQMFAEEGATNVKWVWSPNVEAPSYSPQHPMASYYPGDDYVDWAALDGYNWAEVRDQPWYSFDEIYSQSYQEITGITKKPLMIAETASHTSPGDKAAWIAAVREVVPTKYPRIRALSWFNENAEGAYWLFDTSQASEEAYRSMAADARWQGHLP